MHNKTKHKHVIELQSSTNLMELGIFYSQAMIPTFPQLKQIL